MTSVEFWDRRLLKENDCSLTVEVRVRRDPRLWLGLRIMRIGAWLAGLGYEQEPADRNGGEVLS